MTQQQWTEVDTYLTEALVGEDEALAAALAQSAKAGLPEIAVSPTQGKLLQLLALGIGARRILEVGSLGGYSAIWMGRALPADGRLVSLELSPAHAAVARANLHEAGLEKVAEVRTGRASDSLAELVDDGVEPFDFVFIDADKPSIPEYLEWSVKLTRPGSLIVVDNVVRGGKVADAASEDPSVLGVRRMHELVAQHPRLEGTSIQTVGSRGYDGFTLIRVGA
ncbi:O-methyltransferase [Kitasatospora viridis]|uniref:Putative O-methyltransferase YrrM n=1 Tax=Kitasatospora viridis TaxID=281105 RepID=A0A561SFW5_9ACTN|nr:O-methyltransferase [Kitasatospora viridis]TWF73771.1 putative O-methyltransferase YrrM [Kitasatospora viridis]